MKGVRRGILAAAKVASTTVWHGDQLLHLLLPSLPLGRGARAGPVLRARLSFLRVTSRRLGGELTHAERVHRKVEHEVGRLLRSAGPRQEGPRP